ncbi:MAG: hypothetical protein WD851_00710 [Pirellulales bacterium]
MAQFKLWKSGASITILLFIGATQAFCGSVRYDLPELLGEHWFDGTQNGFDPGRTSDIDTPFGFYSVSRARLVLEGAVNAGRAHGDGIIREAIEFTLDPAVQPMLNFHYVRSISDVPDVGSFRLERIYTYPFTPDPFPLPSPDGYPPISFSVSVRIEPSFSTDIPPLLEPGDDYGFRTGGIVVDLPIVATITTAYIVLEGPIIVPEPTGLSPILVGALATILRRVVRRRSKLRTCHHAPP